jgi:hypothetical protein
MPRSGHPAAAGVGRAVSGRPTSNKKGGIISLLIRMQENRQ